MFLITLAFLVDKKSMKTWDVFMNSYNLGNIVAMLPGSRHTTLNKMCFLFTWSL